MSADRGKQRGQSAPGGYTDPGQRISDADRTAAAELLSKHYGDGRLDQAEFDRRLDQAMKATTYADLDGLFSDLPGGDQRPHHQPAPVPGGAVRPRQHRVALIVLAALAVVIVLHAMSGLFWPALVIAIVVVVLLRGGRRHYRSY
jgi:hypothetical protein